MFRNDRNFYHRNSDKSGKRLVTIYSPDKPYVVYDKEEWWADDWDATSYGRDVDFSRPFLEQFQELRLQTPRCFLFTSNAENSYYTNHALNVKNCHLIWGGGMDEDCLFGNFVTFCTNMVDGLSMFSNQWSYEGIASQNCYNCIHFHNCRDCTDCIMVEDCTSCQNCIGCFGLNRRQYCLFNEQLSEQEWKQRRAELGSLTHNTIALLKNKFDALKTQVPHRASHIYASENCTGDSIYNSRDCTNCFDINDCDQCKHVSFTPKGITTHDACFTAPEGLEMSYNVCSSLGGQRMLFTFLAYYCNDTYYSQECHRCSNLFGCSSMRNNQYCILNKQYTQEEYEVMAGKVIDHMRETGEWGEYFTPREAPICYNESNAQDYFPLTKEDALAKGFSWHDEVPVEMTGEALANIPEKIENVDKTICDRVLTCKDTGKKYKIIPQELAFYKQMGIPIPLKTPVARHLDRLKLRCPRKIWERPCSKCQKPMYTNYHPSRPEIVYCEECYLAEVY